ncbi:MAG: ParB N-terminal domain-containing protein [bacterium]|nr:ParB N-terminal domain-containing protein [bacterium]
MLDALHPNPANPRLNDHAVDPVASSIRRFGWQQPIVAKPNGEIVAGHTRLKAAQSWKQPATGEAGRAEAESLRVYGRHDRGVGAAPSRTATRSSALSR